MRCFYIQTLDTQTFTLAMKWVLDEIFIYKFKEKLFSSNEILVL